MPEMIHLGDKVKDKVSGLTGIVVARTEWLYGCIRLTVQPQELHDGRPVDGYTFDEPQAELIQRGAVPSMAVATPPVQARARTYGDRPSPQQRQTPPR